MTKTDLLRAQLDYILLGTLEPDGHACNVQQALLWPAHRLLARDMQGAGAVTHAGVDQPSHCAWLLHGHDCLVEGGGQGGQASGRLCSSVRSVLACAQEVELGPSMAVREMHASCTIRASHSQYHQSRRWESSAG